MGQPSKQVKTNEIAGLDTFYNGGKGSGNFGHAGRPGKVGGSGKGEGVPTSKKVSDIELEQKGIESRIQGLTERIDSLKKGMEKDEAPKDKEVLDDLKRQLARAKLQRKLADNFKETYAIDYPGDYQLSEIKDVTFREIAKALADGKAIYDVIGDVDSVIRVRAFEYLEDMTKMDYDDFYDAWLGRKSPSFRTFEDEYLK